MQPLGLSGGLGNRTAARTRRCVDGNESSNLRTFRSRASCADTSEAIRSLSRRARSASRSKPISKAVGGSRESARAVDERETDSANEGAPPGALSFMTSCRKAALRDGRSRPPRGASPLRAWRGCVGCGSAPSLCPDGASPRCPRSRRAWPTSSRISCWRAKNDQLLAPRGRKPSH